MEHIIKSSGGYLINFVGNAVKTPYMTSCMDDATRFSNDGDAINAMDIMKCLGFEAELIGLTA